MNNSIFTMLKYEFKSRLGLERDITKKFVISAIINFCFSLIIYSIYIIGLYFISQIVIDGSVPLRYEYLVLATGLSIIIQTVICTGNLVKNLFYDGNNELLLRFPVDGKEIFISKSLFVFIYNIIIAYAFTLPIYIIYGKITGATAGFYLTAIPFIVMISILPFCLANLIALPVINLTNFIKNRFALILALLIIIVVGGFSLYMLVLKGVLEYAQSKSATILTGDLLLQIRKIATSLFPFNLYANVLYGKKAWLSILYIVLINIGFLALSYIVAKRTVYPIILKSIEKEAEAFEIKTTDRARLPFFSLLRKEYLLIFRSLNYSFQYLAMAITAPIMVFFCNDLASSIGDTSVGGRIIPGLTLLVVIIFVTIIISFASTAVSREGNTFYLTKIMPISYTYQIMVKLVLHFVVATASVLISCIIVGAVFGGAKYGRNVTFSDMVLIFFIAEFIIIALTSSAIRNDIKAPDFEVSKSGELVQASKNVSTNILTGCLIAVLYGIITMVFSYIPLTIKDVTIIKDKFSVYYILLAVSALMSGIELFRLFFRLDKRYNKIR